jgi:DNA-binding transcriptional LysR family regulator
MLPTVEGEALRAAGRDVIRAAENIPFRIQQINSLKQGKIAITLTSFLSSALTPALLRFKREYPLVGIELLFNNTDKVFEYVKGNRADFGFSSGREARDFSLTGVTVHRERLLLLARAGHPLCGREKITPEDLRGHLFVIREAGTFTRQFTEEWFDTVPMPSNMIESTRSSSVRDLILGGAVGLAPENVMRADMADGKVCVLPAENFHPWVECRIYASKARPLSAAARTCLDLICREKDLSHAESLSLWLRTLP